MINVMHSVDKPMNQMEKCLDPQLWLACAGGMAQTPPLNSKVYYFPQGHAEHASKIVDFNGFPRIPPLIPCRVSSIKYLADSDTDEVYARIRLVPLAGNECDIDDESTFMRFDKSDEEKEKRNSFAKTLTQSDANNGGGFSVPRYCAEMIFPRLDYSAEPPVQTILVKDVHGLIWKFRHIYRGTPRRHLLTTGWSNFVNQKKLIAGDSVVFLRSENGDLCIGIRRAKMGMSGGGPEMVSSGWNTNCGSSLYGNMCIGNPRKGVDLGVVKEKGNLRGESIFEVASLAASGRPFEAVYYPRANAPEFVVRVSAVRAAMRVNWCGGMRFKMAFDTEDSSRISWFMGTVSSIRVDDPIHWPNSPWRILEVVWDEPDLLQNVKRVNPWLVELVSNIPPIHHHHLSPFSPPRKRPRFPHPSEFHVSQLPMLTPVTNNHHPLSPISPLCCLPDSISAGIQGARHAHFALSSSDLHPSKLQMGLQPFDHSNPPQNSDFAPVSCSLQMGRSSSELNVKKNTAPVFRLFGQSILTEDQISQSPNSSSDGNQEDNNIGNVSNGSGLSVVIQNLPPEASSDEEFPSFKDQCKVFVESEDVGRTLDLMRLGSYEELYGKLADMFGWEKSQLSSNVVYSDGMGTSRHIGEETFGDFTRKARRLTILMDTGSNNR